MDTGQAEDDGAVTPRWCVVANVVRERLHGSEGEVRHGTKHFSPGTKVYLVLAYWGIGGETVKVLGLGRKPRRWITVDVRARVLENWRAKVIYEPAVLRRLAGAPPMAEEEARRIASVLGSVATVDRTRIVVRDPAGVEAAAAELERQGDAVLRASLPPPTVPHDCHAFVLYDGASPIGGAVLVGKEPAPPGWSSLWVRRDRADALAELILAVQIRRPDTNAWSLSHLVAQVRLARDAALP
jgi:hypothetical protein